VASGSETLENSSVEASGDEKAPELAREEEDEETSAGSSSDGGSDDEASTTDAETCADACRGCPADDDERLASGGKTVLLLGPRLFAPPGLSTPLRPGAPAFSPGLRTPLRSKAAPFVPAALAGAARA